MANKSQVLLVANRTATTVRLREAVRRLAERGDTHFHLLVPAHPRGLHRVVDPEVAGRRGAGRAFRRHCRFWVSQPAVR